MNTTESTESTESVDERVEQILRAANIKEETVEVLTGRVEKARESLKRAQESLRKNEERLQKLQTEGTANVRGEAEAIVRQMLDLGGLEDELVVMVLCKKFETSPAPAPDTGAKMDDDLRTAVMGAINQSGSAGFTVSDLADTYSVRRLDVAGLVKDERDAGRVVMTGNKRTARYYLADYAPAQ